MSANNKIYIMSSGSVLISDAVQKLNDKNVILINPYGKNVFTRLIRKLIVRISPRLCFKYLEIKALKNKGFNDLSSEKIIFFDSPYWFSLLPYYNKNITQASVNIWFWNPLKRASDAVLLNELPYKVFTFDLGDSVNQKWGYHPQFYWKNSNDNIINPKIERDLFYIGREKKGESNSRQVMLENIMKQLEADFCTSLIIIISNSKISLPSTSLNKLVQLDDNMSYSNVVDNILTSKAILEINAPGQVGLTLRALEALFYNKKLITNNVMIKEYDFYKEENIYIVGHEERSICDFIKIHPVNIAADVKNKYTFKHWVEFMGKQK